MEKSISHVLKIFWKSNISYPPDTYTYLRVLEGKK